MPLPRSSDESALLIPATSRAQHFCSTGRAARTESAYQRGRVPSSLCVFTREAEPSGAGESEPSCSFCAIGRGSELGGRLRQHGDRNSMGWGLGRVPALSRFSRAREAPRNHALGPRVGTDNTLTMERKPFRCCGVRCSRKPILSNRDVLRAFFLKILRQSLASHPIAARRASNVSSWCGAQA
jgi:hypothetical protein